ncbi:MAG: glycerol-3-phosphate 1-O-acyltransferase PlsY [Chthoniobacteraceae bacterium]
MVPVVAVIVILAYLLGSIPFGLIISKSQGIDIRQLGSGNIGATNVWRMVGKKSGLLTFIGDVAKGLVAVLAAKWIAAHWAIHVPLSHGHERIEFFPLDFAGIAAAMGCILGHSFPVWLGFRGGKGVATSLGVIIGMMPLAALLAFGVWAITFKLSRYVALASIAAAVSFPVIVIGLMFTTGGNGWGYFFFSVAASLLVIRRHRDNIKRLMDGTEHRFGTPKEAKSDDRKIEESTSPSARRDA